MASSSKQRVERAVQNVQASVPGAAIQGFTVDLGQYDLELRLEQLLKEVTEAQGCPSRSLSL